MSYVSRLALPLAPFVVACTAPPEYDLIIRNGTVCDGSGLPGVIATFERPHHYSTGWAGK